MPDGLNVSMCCTVCMLRISQLQKSATMTSYSVSKHDRIEIWKWRNVNYPITANFVSYASSIINHIGFLFINFVLLHKVFPICQWRPSFGFEFSVSSALFTTLAFSYIGSGTARHSSSERQPNFAVWYKEWNYGTFEEGATYIRLRGHHVGHRSTF